MVHSKSSGNQLSLSRLQISGTLGSVEARAGVVGKPAAAAARNGGATLSIKLLQSPQVGFWPHPPLKRPVTGHITSPHRTSSNSISRSWQGKPAARCSMFKRACACSESCTGLR